MRISLLFIISFLISLNAAGQKQLVDQTGYSSLTIQLSGDYPNQLPVEMINYGTVFKSDLPTEFDRVNDSTLFLSIHSYGPVRLYFYYDSSYKKTFLLPNHHDVLRIHYSNPQEYSFEYNGIFKDHFDLSDQFHTLTQDYVFGGHGVDEAQISKEYGKPYENAQSFKDNFQQAHVDNMDDFLKTSEKNIATDFFKKDMLRKFMAFELIAGYAENNIAHNRVLGVDSLEAKKLVPKRDTPYYFSLIDTLFADFSGLLSVSKNILEIFLNDPILGLPELSEVGASRFSAYMHNHLGDRGQLFNDLMFASAYLSCINEGKYLSKGELFEVVSHIHSEQLKTFLLLENEKINRGLNNGKVSDKSFFLPFSESNGSDVLMEIIEKHPGKAVFVDFWATWCGPCIQGFSVMKPLKEKYANSNDVVFLYITDESSDVSKWKEYVNILGEGQHYYISKEQQQNLYEKYEFDAIPTYMVFDRKGELLQENIGHLSNEVAEKWLKEALAD